MADVTVELGNAYIGSAYSPVVVISDTAEGHTVSITSADPEAQGQLVTQSYTVPDWSDEEAEREAQEAARQAAESAREAAEDERAEAEQARAAAESGRANAEAERRGYEQARRADESARVAAEQARQAAESARAGAESVRQSAEQSRSASEVERRQAEHERRVAEELRAQAEDARQSAEEAREAAEQTRQADTAAAIARADAATAAAGAATTAAQAATTAADTAAQGADEAAERADTAREAIDSHLRWADGNVPVGHLPEGGMLQADDAYATLPIGATAYGASTQDGTPAPDAPVPIASVTDLSLMLTGRNLLDTERWVYVEEDTKTVNGVTITREEDGWFRVSGARDTTGQFSITMWGSGAYEPKMQWMGLHPGDDIYVTVETEGTPFVDGGGSSSAANGTCITLYGSTSSVSRRYCGGFADEGAWTIPASTNYLSRIVYYNGANVPVGTEVNGRFRLTIVRGTEAPAAYIPYEGSTLPIDLQGHELRSLPDGTRDELAVDALGHVTLTQRVGFKELVSSDVWQVQNSGTASWYYEVRYASDTNGVQTTDLLSNRYVGAAITNTGTDKGIWLVVSGAGLYFRIREDAEKSLADFKTWLDSNPVTVIYPLATPVSHDLGTVTLPTLPSPDLTAWPATDVPTTMALDYERDIQTALTEARDEAMAAIADPDGPTATANHAAGTYLTMGGRLYKVTTAIATGEAIVPGTNVTATTVMAEVLALTQ